VATLAADAMDREQLDEALRQARELHPRLAKAGGMQVEAHSIRTELDRAKARLAA